LSNAREKFESKKLPMMPIRDVVIFPYMMTPFVVGRESSVHALEEALAGDKKIFLATQHDASIDEPKPNDIFQVGTIVNIVQSLKLPDGNIKVLVEGIERGKILQVTEAEGFMQATVRVARYATETTPQIEAGMQRVTALFEQHGTIMRFDSDMFNLKLARQRMDFFDGNAQITAHSGGFDGWSLLVKRFIDLTGSLLMLIALAPMLLIVAILIKVASPGPVFFGQKRVGLSKRQFVMYKFRTMVPNAELLQSELLHLNEMTGPVFKITNDPRVTRIGRFLRKSSIDELPQLFNVLIGDMSLVGPRAMSVRDYQFFSEDWQRRRFSVKPGITCLWQIHGRNSVPFEKWMELDMQYIDKWSLWLDLKILARTVPAVLRGTGAA